MIYLIAFLFFIFMIIIGLGLVWGFVCFISYFQTDEYYYSIDRIKNKKGD